MQTFNKKIIPFHFLFFTFILMAFYNPGKKSNEVQPAKNTIPKIQVAILLDVSGSMDGLIEQAKAQLWNMVSVMGKTKCNNIIPQIEIALYEYGRPANGIKKGYVKQVDSFTSDLDQLSKHLFALQTDGGDEYCGQVIFTSLSELKWDTSSLIYKVVFIAGNEDFLQGSLHYSKACDEAKKKGIIVNTIYCGNKLQGIREHWNLAGECGSGSYTSINQDEKADDIPTPYDSTLFVLNEALNGTYVYFGSAGQSKFADQASMDKRNYEMSKEVAAKRVSVKAKGNLYNNASWDLIDAQANDSMILENLDRKTLREDLQNKSRTELKQLINNMRSKRLNLQKEISDINNKREMYVSAEKRKVSNKTGATLESEIEKIIKVQAKRFNLIVQ